MHAPLLFYNTMNFHIIENIFFPPVCVACGDHVATGVICEACRKGIDVFDTLFCGTCTARLPELKKICHADAPYILGAAGRYDDKALQAMIHALKFQGITSAATPLAGILADYVAGLHIDVGRFVTTPVPLSEKRLRARGFNQSALIASHFSEITGIPFEKDLLKRIHHRKPQSETQDIFERKENVRGCFALDNANAIAGKNIILIDDVTTSGTTFAETAYVLKSGGAKKIIALAIARA
jgi:ComF family protein